MSVIGTLAVNVAANTGKLTGGLNKAKREVHGFAATTTHSVEKLHGAFHGLHSVMGLLAGAEIVHVFHNAMEQAHALEVVSEKLHLNVETIQEYNAIAKQFGLSQEGITKSLAFFNKTLGGAVNGNEKAAKAFERLGMDVDKAKLHTLAQNFNEAIDAIHNLPTDVQQAAAAVSLFGKSGQDLLPVIRAGSEELEHIKEQLRLMGGVASEDAIANLAKLQKQVDLISSAFVGMKLQVLSAFEPFVKTEIAKVTIAMKALHEVIDAINEAFSKEGWQRYFQFMTGDRRALMPASPKATAAAGTPPEWKQWIEGHKLMDQMGITTSPYKVDPQFSGMKAFASMFSPQGDLTEAQIAHIQTAVESRVAMMGSTAQRNRIDRYTPQGNAALESGTAAAFSQARRSQQQNQVLELNKKQLTEAQKHTKSLQEIDNSLKQSLRETQVTNLA